MSGDGAEQLFGGGEADEEADHVEDDDGASDGAAAESDDAEGPSLQVTVRRKKEPKTVPQTRVRLCLRALVVKLLLSFEGE